MKTYLMLAAGLVFLAACQNQPAQEAEKPAVQQQTQQEAAPATEKAEAMEKKPDGQTPAQSAGGQTEDQTNEGEQQPPEGLPAKLAHRNFVIQSIDGQPFNQQDNPDGSKPHKPNLSFGQWPHASGKICNSYSGRLEWAEETLKMTAASTMMMCFDQEVNRLESLFHQMMNKGVKAEFDGQTLTLSNDEHVLVFSLADYVS